MGGDSPSSGSGVVIWMQGFGELRGRGRGAGPTEWALITSPQMSGYHTGYSCSYALLIGLRLVARQLGRRGAEGWWIGLGEGV